MCMFMKMHISGSCKICVHLYTHIHVYKWSLHMFMKKHFTYFLLPVYQSILD